MSDDPFFNAVQASLNNANADDNHSDIGFVVNNSSFSSIPSQDSSTAPHSHIEAENQALKERMNQMKQQMEAFMHLQKQQMEINQPHIGQGGFQGQQFSQQPTPPPAEPIQNYPNPMGFPQNSYQSVSLSRSSSASSNTAPQQNFSNSHNLFPSTNNSQRSMSPNQQYQGMSHSGSTNSMLSQQTPQPNSHFYNNGLPASMAGMTLQNGQFLNTSVNQQPQANMPQSMQYNHQQPTYPGMPTYGNFTMPNQQAPISNSSFTPEMMNAMMSYFMQNQSIFQSQNKPPSQTHESSKSESSCEEENYESCEDQKECENPLRKEEKFSGPKKTLNILVLGETGVGKSTWINGIANYMSFDTLEEALNAPQPICLIPSQFSFYQTNEEKIEVKLEPSHGQKDENEVFSTEAQSATQAPKTYQFETPKYIVNIIDTPGIGDTRGPFQDKENTRKILNAISNYKDLHAICFLFKANEARMTQSFRYCIGELLLQLHKNAVDNIIFFFTNARGTFYKPGDTMTPLGEFLKELQKDRGLQIELGGEKICCTDNEAFRLVCAHHSGAKFTEDEFKNFAGSWKQSAEATHRFIEFAARQQPHCVADTVSINKARGIILYLAKPLADVNELIESNIKVFNDRKKDLQNSASTLEDLKKKLKIPQIGIEVKPLPYPKTVCAGTNCIDTQKIPNSEQLQTIYKTICHDHCYLTGVDVEKVPEPHLQSCAAMSGGKCSNCECQWSTHMHIRFDQIKASVEVEDKNIKNAIKTNEDATVTKQKMINDCENTITDLKAEQQQIIKTSLKFGSFLQTNAILPYNDAFEKYVEQTVEEEEKCTKVGGDRTKLDNLKKLLSEYRQEKKLLDQAAQNPVNANVKGITGDDIEEMKKDLFQLKHTGKTLETLFKATEDGISKHCLHITVKYNPPFKKPLINFGKYKKDESKKKHKKSKDHDKPKNDGKGKKWTSR